jgi:hypothetical protein
MYQDKINKILNSIDDVIEIAKATATVEIYAYQKDRIFNKGEDKNLQSIGVYSNPYKKIRSKKGLQTAFVDQKFSGNLQQSVTYSKDTIYFKNEYGKKVSGYNEVHFKKRIYAPSQPEKEIYFDILETELNKLWK